MNAGTVVPQQPLAREPSVVTEPKGTPLFTLDVAAKAPPADQLDLLKEIDPHRVKHETKQPQRMLERTEKGRVKEKDKQKGPEHKEVLGLVQSFSSQLQHHGAATTLTAKHATQAQPAAEPKSSLHAAPRRREAESTERRVEQATSKAVESAAPPAPSSAAPRSSDAPAEVAAPAQARPAELSPEHTLLQLALVDTSLQVDVRQSVVQVAMQTEAAGALALEVRMHEGQAHVRIDGPASPLVAQRADELRAVLSQQGLSLGNFTSGQGQGQQPALDVDDQRVPSAGPARVNDPARARHEGRIDVEA